MRKFIHAIALLLTLSLSAPVLAGPFEDGLTAYNKSDYTTARRLWRPLADQGNARAQLYLGLIYDKGQGVAQDYAQAVKWYRMAADQGDANAPDIDEIGHYLSQHGLALGFGVDLGLGAGIHRRDVRPMGQDAPFLERKIKQCGLHPRGELHEHAIDLVVYFTVRKVIGDAAGTFADRARKFH